MVSKRFAPLTTRLTTWPATVLLAADESFPCKKVLPAYRPETALHLNSPISQAWIVKLEEVCGQKAATLSELENALEKRALYFRESGCLIVDQSLLSLILHAEPEKRPNPPTAKPYPVPS